ncbi:MULTISPECIES: HutD family protein [unclassified Salinibacterium]|uniref:HutD/Ves family protein n=1 Tax=unclassified Salinibacterium TaxID=2632331 RepID=UPI00143D14A0|nr:MULTISPECIES: HutD family protein [unclassified Salinibacterium]
MSGLGLVRAGDRVATPWRNGEGLTSEVAAGPEGAGLSDFAWRVSIATIAQDSEFSPFRHVDRWLVPLDEPGLELDIDGTRRLIERHSTVTFTGEADVAAREVHAPSRDLNLMVDRRRCRGALSVMQLQGEALVRTSPAQWVVVVALDGPVRVHPLGCMEALDALVIPPSETVALSGDGPLAIAQVELRAR